MLFKDPQPIIPEHHLVKKIEDKGFHVNGVSGSRSRHLLLTTRRVSGPSAHLSLILSDKEWEALSRLFADRPQAKKSKSNGHDREVLVDLDKAPANFAGPEQGTHKIKRRTIMPFASGRDPYIKGTDGD